MTTRAMTLAISDTVTMTTRYLYHYLRKPSLLGLAVAQPVLFVLLWTYVFSGAIQTPGGIDYVDYLMPGLFILAIAFGSANTGVGLADDLARGLLDRFRALPMARPALLVGRTLADTARNTFVVLLMVAVGYAVGFRFHAGPAAALTGPVARGDTGTVRRNLEALWAHAPEAVPAYVVLAESALDLAVRAGRLAPEARSGVEEVLEEWR